MRVAVVVFAVAWLASCAGPEGGRPEAWRDPFCAETQPRVDAFLDSVARAATSGDSARYGGTAVVASVADIGMSPLATVDVVSRQYQQFALLMTLVAYDADLRPVPYLARSWEISPDSTSLTFHLRSDVRWHDGRPTTARDVAYTFRIMNDPASGFPNPAYWEPYDTGPGGVEVVDDTTVVFAMRPHADVLDPWRLATILPAHLLEDVPPEQHARHPFTSVCPVGNGPFAFVRHDLDDRWIFRANPAFPDGLGGRPYVDRLVHRVVPEQTTLLSELLTGGVHAYLNVAPDQAERIEDAPGVTLRRFPNTEVAFVAWNARRPKLADRRVRRALTMAVDREEIVDAIVRGYGVVANTGVPPIHWAHAPGSVSRIPFDPDSARVLLEEAGWSDRDGDGVRENTEGTPLSITLKYNRGSQERHQIAELLQARLATVGVLAQPTVVEASTLGAQIFDPAVRDFDGFIISWSQDLRLDESDFFHSTRLDGPFAMSGTRNEELDRLLDALRDETDRERAAVLWRDYQRAIVEEQPFTYLYFADRLVGTSEALRGVEMDVRGDLLGVRDWWLEPAGR